MTKCLYCKKEKELSESHIIPESLCQNGPTLLNGVCKECNILFGKIEQPLIKGFSVIRSLLGIKGKRKRLPSFIVEANFMGMIMPLSVYKPSDVEKRPLIFARKSSKERKKVYLFGSTDYIESQQLKLSQRYKKINWDEVPEDTKQLIRYEIKIDYTMFGTEDILRLASKIAFEWLCRQKGDVELLLGQEYDDIRNYIIDGYKPSYPIACIVTHSNILSGLYMPFGIHQIVTSYNFDSSEIVAIVVLFGLVAYKIVLTKRYRLSTRSLTLVTVHPQTGQIYKPRIRGQLNDPKLYGHAQNDFIAPMEAIRILSPQITKKINSSGFVISE